MVDTKQWWHYEQEPIIYSHSSKCLTVQFRSLSCTIRHMSYSDNSITWVSQVNVKAWHYCFDYVQLRHNEHPHYLGVTLDWSRAFKIHLLKTATKVRRRTLRMILRESTHKYCGLQLWPWFTLLMNMVLLCGLQLHDTRHLRYLRTIRGTLMAKPLPLGFQRHVARMVDYTVLCSRT